MLRQYSLLLLLALPVSSFAQDTIKSDTTVTDSLNPDEVDKYVFYDAEASFPGEEKAMKAYFAKNLVYPSAAAEKNIMGSVTVYFVVRSNGKITNVSIKKSLPNCPQCDEEALRLIKNMPDWIPAIAYGKYVDTSVELPVKFRK